MINSSLSDNAQVLPSSLTGLSHLRPPPLAVVALQSLSHEQFPQVLGGELLHVLAVVVNLT